METTNQKTTIDTHIKKKKQTKCNTTYSHQITREQNIREEKRPKINLKQLRKKIYPFIAISVLIDVTGLNAATKIHRLAEWIQKQDPYLSCLQETHLRSEETYRLKVMGCKKLLYI